MNLANSSFQQATVVLSVDSSTFPAAGPVVSSVVLGRENASGNSGNSRSPTRNLRQSKTGRIRAKRS